MADCTRRRIPIPPPYDDPPTIGPEFNLFMWAFNALSEGRELSIKTEKQILVNRIKFRDIREWADFYGYLGDQDFMFELVEYIRALDAVWIDYEVKRLKRSK